MIILQLQAEQCRKYSCVSLAQGLPLSQRRVLFIVLVSESQSSRTFVSMLKPLHASAAVLAYLPLAAQQLAHQMTIKWPCMQRLMLSDVEELHGLGREIASQLVQGTWTTLVDLCLMGCDLRSPEFLLLSQGNWPHLQYLDVSKNCLDAEGMAALAKGKWPLLMSINLGSNPTLDAAAIAHLSAANWPIAQLKLSHTPVSAVMAAELAHLQLPDLMRLHLNNTGLTAAAVSELARADWPLLRYLSLGLDDVEAVGSLGLDLDKVQEPNSEALDGTTVHQRNMVSLPGGVGWWPNLSHVKVSKHGIELLVARI